ncbi:MAG: PTS sugar transporter subunit IIA [Verrucomicrobiaceae bacterium]|nr:MAG: PTS sugar transporter subunit IIA [Verrucomicrobiaceae bacterium]
MKSLLNALQDGRLIELPDNDKTSALELLATLIEAIPDNDIDEGITEKVLEREQVHNTGIGKGWACPHARCSKDGELLCAVGWSPNGIAYGSPDGNPVHLVVMYFVPDTQKNAYLKEISSLAKAIQSQDELQNLQSLTELGDVRHSLLDAITVALESTAPDARARMIQLKVRHAEAHEPTPVFSGVSPDDFLPVSVISIPGAKPVVLAQNRDLVEALESDASLGSRLGEGDSLQSAGIRLILRHVNHFQPDRSVYEFLAFKPAKPGEPGSGLK